MKKVGETTRPFRYDLNQIPYDYTVEVMTDWFKIGKEVQKGCTLSPCLFNLYLEYIMRKAGLDESQAGIKIARRNINNLRYIDDSTQMTESKEELKAS